jgi:GGDEF domain-containing protein
VLRRAAIELGDVVGEDALLARQAGDEFLALLTDTDMSRARASCERIANRLRHSAGGSATASVGWALSSASERAGLPELVRRADAMMYQEKSLRRADKRVAA